MILLVPTGCSGMRFYPLRFPANLHQRLGRGTSEKSLLRVSSQLLRSFHQPSGAGAAHELLLDTSLGLWGATSIARGKDGEADIGEVTGQGGHRDGFPATGALVACHSSV